MSREWLASPREIRFLAEAGHGLRRPWRSPVSLPEGHVRPTTLEGHIRPTTLPEGHIRPTTLARCVIRRQVWPGAFSHAAPLTLGDLFIYLATAAARRRGGSALGRRVHVSPSRLLGAAYRHTLPPHRKVCTPSERCPGHGGAWEVRRTDSSSSFSCACRRRGARTLSFCRIAPSKSFDSMAAAEASPPLAQRAANSARG